MINFTTAILFIKKYWRSIALFSAFIGGVVCCLYIWTINNQRKLDHQRISCLESELAKVTVPKRDDLAQDLGALNDNVPSKVQPKEIKKALPAKSISKEVSTCEKNNESISKNSVDNATGYDFLNDRPDYSFSNNDCEQDQALEQLLNEMMEEEPCQNNLHENNVQNKTLAAHSTGNNEKINAHSSEPSSQTVNGFARSNDDASDHQSQNSNSNERQAVREMLDENIAASKRELLRIQAEQVKEQCKAEINRKIREQISGSVQ
jgi:hypothetical protein